MKRFLRRRANRSEIDPEIETHLAEKTDALVARGLSPDEARRQARRDFGNVSLTRELSREEWSFGAWERFAGDIRFAVISWRRNPAFAITAILTLALGIGSSTAIFSVADAVLLRPLPYPHPQQIVRIWEQAPNGHTHNFADPNFDDFRTQNNTFAALAVYELGLSSVSGGSEPARVNVANVSSDFFKVLGVEPFRGRSFDAQEQRLHGAPAALVSHAYWQRYLASADFSKTRLRIEGTVYPVIGVMPAGFDFPPGAAVWIPRELAPEIASRTAHNWRGLGRVRDGVTVAQAHANLSAIARRIKQRFGKEVDLNDAAVVPLAEALVGDMRAALLTLLTAVALLLLVACANVAGLLVARTSARRKELAVRAALGAGRGRLIQQFLAECFSLSFAGGLLGLLLAAWAVRVLPAILPAKLPRQQTIAINTPVLLFASAAVLAVALTLGLFAAWRADRADLQEALTAGSRGHTGSAASQRLRAFVVIGQIAATLVILVGAGLLGRSFFRLLATSPGFNQQNLITMEFSPPNPQGQFFALDQAAIARQVRQLQDISTRLRHIPGVQSVGLAGALPVAAGDNLADGDFLVLHGRPSPATFEEWGRMAQNPSQIGHATYCVAGSEYFRTMGIPLIRGRLFGPQDAWNSPHVAVISQALARERWPQQDPIGETIDYGNMDGHLQKPLTIVGIAGDVRARGLDLPPSPIIYVDYRQRGMNVNSQPTILLRSALPPAEIVADARGIFHDLAPDAPVKFSTFGDEMGGWLADRRFLLLLVASFAAAALALAAVGIYGVVAFSVTRRTQEIGIRTALGAQRIDVLRLILREGARLALLGVAIGVVASLLITRLLSTLLFGINPTDPLTFVGVAALLSLVALAASFLPAHRATRVDPMIALRYE